MLYTRSATRRLASLKSLRTSVSKSGGMSMTLTVEESFVSFETTKTLWVSSAILESEDFLYERAFVSDFLCGI